MSRPTATPRDPAIELVEWSTLGPDDDVPGRPLRGFRFEDPDVRALARRLTRENRLELTETLEGLHVRARSHVGRVQLGPLTITVRPKLGPHALLKLFGYAYGLASATRLGATRYAPTGALFADLIVAQLHDEARALLERGIAHAYVRTSEELAGPRGRIDFAALTRQGGVTRAALPCIHHPRSTDHLLNQVLAAGLTEAGALVSDPALRIAVRRLAALAHTLATPVPLSAERLETAKRRLNRLVAPYASVLDLIELLHTGTLLELEHEGRTRRMPGFLFDMNRFWQRLLDRFLTENLAGYRVEPEHALSSLMRYRPGANPRNRVAPTPRPDFAIRDGQRVVALLDAKYRDLWELPLPREMLYQLSLYSLSQPGRATAAILYPTTDRAAKSSTIEIRDPVTREPTAFVELRPVVLPALVDLLAASSRTGETRRQLARALVFGLNVN